MKKGKNIIGRIALAELQNLFYSPIMWVMLIAFLFMAGMFFSGQFGELIRRQELNYPMSGITGSAFAGIRGLFTQMQNYLFIFIPLMTMGLMSRELSSGTIKLLYSSPVTNGQIVMGKFLSTVWYSLILTGILGIYVVFGLTTIHNVDAWPLMSALLGMFLVMCAYSSIGLFMSSLTSYQIPALIFTLAVLAGLNYVDRVGQSIELVRDITYWLSITGRANEMVYGMIASEDVLYFLLVISLFLSLATLRLQARRQKKRWQMSLAGYTAVIVTALALGYASSRPWLRLYADTTQTKMLTITPATQALMKQLKGGLTITTYNNFLDKFSYIVTPAGVNYDIATFKRYMRFKPEIKLKYVYYYDKVDNPNMERNYPGLTDKERMAKMARVYRLDTTLFKTPEQIRSMIDLSGEENHFVRLIERADGRKTFLRVFDDMMVQPGETEFAAAFKRLVMELPRVAFIQGHGERDFNRDGDRGYRRFAMERLFRHSLINQGFDFELVNLDRPISDSVDIVVLADMRLPMSAEQRANFDAYIARGGNVLIAGDLRRQEEMNPIIEQFGVRFMQGQLVKPSEEYQPDLIMARPSQQAKGLSWVWDGMLSDPDIVVTMPGAVAIEQFEDRGWKSTPLFESDPAGWNELETTEFIDDTVTLDATAEMAGARIAGLALSRKVGEKDQKIVVLGDADALSNGEIAMGRKGVQAANFNMVMGAFHWMSDGQAPVDVRRPPLPDDGISLSSDAMRVWKVIFTWGLPLLLLGIYFVVWLRRRGR